MSKTIKDSRAAKAKRTKPPKWLVKGGKVKPKIPLRGIVDED